MLSRLVRTLLLPALVAVLAALPATAGAAGPSSPQPTALLREMNRARAARGLRSLVADRALSRAALAHSRDMAARGYFAHGDFARRMLRFEAAARSSARTSPGASAPTARRPAS